MTRQRIQYIDLAKGVCILLVIMVHCRLEVPLPALRLPVYFMLSGLFFKDYGSWGNFLLKKANNLLVPFVFFYLVGYAIYYAIAAYYPADLYDDYHILDVFRHKYCFNIPIWFLLCLFWCNAIYYGIQQRCRTLWGRAAAVVVLGAVGCLLGIYGVPLPCYLDGALSAMPFFFIGVLLGRTQLLMSPTANHRHTLCAIAALVVMAVISIAAGNPGCVFVFNEYVGNIAAYYLLSIVAPISLLLICKAIGYLPIVSYIGRYSIVVLCVHILWKRALMYAQMYMLPDTYIDWPNRLYLTLAVTAFSVLSIPICLRLIPWFVAQKELLTRRQPQRSVA